MINGHGGPVCTWIVLTPQSIGEDGPPEQGGACPWAPRKVVTELEILVSCTWHGLSDSDRSLLPLSQDNLSEAVRRLQGVGPVPSRVALRIPQLPSGHPPLKLLLSVRASGYSACSGIRHVLPPLKQLCARGPATVQDPGKSPTCFCV